MQLNCRIALLPLSIHFIVRHSVVVVSDGTLSSNVTQLLPVCVFDNVARGTTQRLSGNDNDGKRDGGVRYGIEGGCRLSRRLDYIDNNAPPVSSSSLS